MAEILLRGERARALLGLWFVWAALFAIETYTSGIAWMLNHMGPGSFIAVVWLAAALPTVWPTAVPTEGGRGWAWLRAGMVTAMALFALGGLHSIRPPLASLPLDADRYASDIEREFADRPAASVLLDHGSWLYLRQGIVQKDRSAAAGEAGFTGATDFHELMERIRSHHYDRILVRNLHAPTFMYDHHSWESQSGVRDTLLRYYREARVIPAVEAADNIWLRPISVLEPRVIDELSGSWRCASIGSSSPEGQASLAPTPPSTICVAGARVTILDNFSRRGSKSNAEWLQQSSPPGRLTIVRADVRSDHDALSRAFDGADIWCSISPPRSR